MTVYIKRRKLCKGCGEMKLWAEFHPDAQLLKQGKWRPRYRCKKCLNKQSKAWNEKNAHTPEQQRKSKNATLLRKYGITIEEYEALLAAQGGVCLICQRSPEEVNRPFCVDHDHVCCPGGKSCGECIRGILCNTCNSVLGQMEENPIWISRMLEFVRPKFGLPVPHKQSMMG